VHYGSMHYAYSTSRPVVEQLLTAACDQRAVRNDGGCRSVQTCATMIARRVALRECGAHRHMPAVDRAVVWCPFGLPLFTCLQELKLNRLTPGLLHVCSLAAQQQQHNSSSTSTTPRTAAPTAQAPSTHCCKHTPNDKQACRPALLSRWPPGSSSQCATPPPWAARAVGRP
jgi:hypothetical protein